MALDWETILAPHDLDTALGVIPKDTICAHRWQLSAMCDERPVVSVQYFATVTSTPWPDTWPRPAQSGKGGMVFRIEGSPNMTLDLRLDAATGDATNPGVAATAMAAINAIPAVIEAAPGLLPAPLAGPAIVTGKPVAAQRLSPPRSPASARTDVRRSSNARSSWDSAASTNPPSSSIPTLPAVPCFCANLARRTEPRTRTETAE